MNQPVSSDWGDWIHGLPTGAGHLNAENWGMALEFTRNPTSEATELKTSGGRVCDIRYTRVTLPQTNPPEANSGKQPPQVAAVNLNLIPESLDDCEPTEADIDKVVEEATSETVKLANLAAGIASMRHRIAQLEAKKIKVLNLMGKDFEGTLKNHLGDVNEDLVTASDLLATRQAVR